MDGEETDRLWRENIATLANQVHSVVEGLRKVGNIGDGMGVTEEEKRQAYSLGYQFYLQKKYDKAMVIFRALHMLDPLCLTFSKAYASALHMGGDRSTAAFHYLMAYFIHPEDLELALLCGRCMVELGQTTQAYLTLNGIAGVPQLVGKAEDKKQVEVFRTFLSALKEKALEDGGKGRPKKNVPASSRKGGKP
jgi:hypothetical protein